MSKRSKRVGKDLDVTKEASDQILKYLAEWGIKDVNDVDPLTALDIIAFHSDGWERGLALIVYISTIKKHAESA